MITGGVAVWRHYLIRFLLRRTHAFPWNASLFLDDATTRILLQHLGGGYRFTHRLLMDYLANTAEDNTESMPALITTSFPPNLRVSRRTALIAGSVAVGAAGVAGLFALTQHSHQGRTIAFQTSVPPQTSGSPQKATTPPGLLLTYRGHSGGVNSVAWSPDGKRIASGSADKTVQVWDASDGRNVFTYRGHSDTVFAVTWSPDQLQIASGSQDSTVQVWDVSDGGNVFTYRGHSDTVFAVTWSPSGQQIASGSGDSTVQVWDANNGYNGWTYGGHSAGVLAVAWSPDGLRIASGSTDKTVQVWDANNGGSAFIYRGHSEEVNTVEWSPDGLRIASGADDYKVQVWPAE